MPQRFEQAAMLLTPALRRSANIIKPGQRGAAEEFRLRVGQFFSVTLPEGEVVPDPQAVVTREDVMLVLENAAQGSIHTIVEKMRRGFITVPGGHRIGICGSAVMVNGSVESIRDISSLCIRIAREVTGAADKVIPNLLQNGLLCNTLILSPPGQGKTTLLRDIVRQVSQGSAYMQSLRVALADERGEIACCFHGTPQLNVGPLTDVLDGAPKAAASMLLVRAMNPQVLALDEITAPEDISAIETCVGCGVTVVATAHAGSWDDIRKRTVYKEIPKLFQKAVFIRRENSMRKYTVEDVIAC